MGGRIAVMKLICSLRHCECDGDTVRKLSQWLLTADWLAPRMSDCSRMHSKVSTNRLPSYIKATPPVLEILKMAVYFPDSFRITNSQVTTDIVLLVGLKYVYPKWQLFLTLDIVFNYRSENKFACFKNTRNLLRLLCILCFVYLVLWYSYVMLINQQN
jgi:hypothetical protein